MLLHARSNFNSPLQAVDGSVHRSLALLVGPDGQEVERAAGQTAEEREQGHPGADLEK